ncbi:indole-3-glycerol phosphate synthase TrpC [Pseudarthrobacter sp. J1738]|uniref:indole-3-glycerol phosphate synthase TrpC n=1 Tax=unclassified Pseudarthrobacter TaxID=2647000 RepID=UPI003D2C51EE
MTVLEDIIVGVTEDLDVRRRDLALEDLKAIALSAPAARDAYAALGGDELPREQMRVIAEIKRKSPSKGALAGISDPAALAEQYQDGGASVISVLTEQRRFGGSLSDLDAVRERVSIPLLRKDFTVDEYQIWEARAHGADLILLIVAALSDAKLREFLDLTHSLGMNALVETHTEDEIDRAVALGAKIIGVNVRNLKTLDVDRGIFASLAHRIPASAIVVAESGVRSAQDVADYASHGAHAVLVGEALVSDGKPAQRIAEFRAIGAQAMTSR